MDEGVFLMTYGSLPSIPRSTMVYGDTSGRVIDRLPLSLAVIRTASSTVVFDVGASPAWARRKEVLGYVDPRELLEDEGPGIDSVDCIVLSHLHWDHASNLAAFAGPTIVVQRRELEGWRAALSWGPAFAWVHAGRVEADLVEHLEMDSATRLADGDIDLGNGVRCHLAPGHTFGTQFVSVFDRTRQVVLASDVVFVRENLERMIPLGNGLDQVEMLRSFRRVGELEARGALVVPGHDPDLEGRFERVSDRTVRIA